MRQVTPRIGRTFGTRNSDPARRHGAALVEMAIVLPVLLILTLGLIEYGWVFLKISQINMAARHGVRTAIRPDATDAQVTAAVAAMMTQGGMQGSGYTLTSAYTPDGGTSTPGIAAAVGEPVTVHVSVDYGQLSLTGTGLIPLPGQIQGRGTMAKEGPSSSPPP